MIKDDSLELLQVVMSSARSLLLRAGCLIKRWFVLVLILMVCVLSPNHLIWHLASTVTHTFIGNCYTNQCNVKCQSFAIWPPYSWWGPEPIISWLILDISIPAMKEPGDSDTALAMLKPPAMSSPSGGLMSGPGPGNWSEASAGDIGRGCSMLGSPDTAPGWPEWPNTWHTVRSKLGET